MFREWIEGGNRPDDFAKLTIPQLLVANDQFKPGKHSLSYEEVCEHVAEHRRKNADAKP
jgi:hypothetical protein